MAQGASWHSSKPNLANVYHNNDRCKNGNSIASRYCKQGTDSRPLCGHCKRLNEQATASTYPRRQLTKVGQLC